MLCRYSWVILLGQEHRAIVEQVGIRVVSVDKENFGNISAPRPTFDLDDDIERIGDVSLDGSVRKFDTALQDTTRETRETLLRGICVDRRERAGVSRVQELQQIERFAAANLPEHDSVRAVAEGSLQEIANGYCRKTVLFAARFEPDEVFLAQVNLRRVFDDEDPLLLRDKFSKHR